MNIRQYLIGVLIVSVVFTPLAFAQTESVVSIYKTSSSGTSQGTGFFVSRRGDVATAFHVVDNARKISVFDHEGNEYTNVVLRWWDPDADIAILKIDSEHVIRPLPLSRSVPTNSMQLTAVGHPRGILNQTITARTTQSGYLSSLAIPDASGRPLFSKELDVIPVDITLYSGMSGAPLIDDQGTVVGLLSGSLHEGGSYAWAIPAIRIAAVMEGTPLDRWIDPSLSWPRFELMAGQWQAALRRYRFNAEAQDIFDSFRRNLSRLSRANQELRSASMVSVSSISSTCISVESALSSSSSSITSHINELYEQLRKRPPSTLDTINSTLQNDLTLSVTQDSLRKLMPVIELRWQSESALRSATREVLGWLSNAALSDREREFFDEVQERLGEMYPELAFETLEAVHRIDVDAILRFNASVTRSRRLQFSHETDAEDFVAECKRVRDAVEVYGRLYSSLSDDPLAKEVEMFQVYYRLARHFREHLTYPG